MDEAKGFIRTIATAEDPSLVRCFRGHEKTVTSVDFSQDMKQIVSGGADGIVEVWNFKPQIRPFKFVGHKGPVNHVLFNAQATKVFSCGEDRDIRIWKNTVEFLSLLRNGKNKAVKAHSGAILKLDLSREEDFLISCSSDKTVKMWNPDGKFKQSFTGHTNWVRECCISPDQRMILSCSDDKSVRLWDIEKSVVSANFNEHKSSVISCKFTPDGTCVAGASIDGTIKVWDTRLSKMIQHYNAHDSAVNEISFHPLGCHMASVSDDNKIKIWDLKKGTLEWTLFGHEGNIKCLKFSEKGDYFATGGTDKLVMAWMTNFDKEMNEQGRRIESNFREKIDGKGVQPLFKSNIIKYKGSISQENETNMIPQERQTQNDRETSFGLNKGETKISEVVCFELEKMVNQLDYLTKTLDKMDKHLTEHEQIIDKLENNEQVDNILCEMDNRKLLIPTIYNSAWEAEQELEKKVQQVEREIENESENDEDEQLINFLREEERRKKAFQEQMNEEQGLRFSASEINREF